MRECVSVRSAAGSGKGESSSHGSGLHRQQDTCVSHTPTQTRILTHDTHAHVCKYVCTPAGQMLLVTASRPHFSSLGTPVDIQSPPRNFTPRGHTLSGLTPASRAQAPPPPRPAVLCTLTHSPTQAQTHQPSGPRTAAHTAPVSPPKPHPDQVQQEAVRRPHTPPHAVWMPSGRSCGPVPPPGTDRDLPQCPARPVLRVPVLWGPLLGPHPPVSFT